MDATDRDNYARRLRQMSDDELQAQCAYAVRGYRCLREGPGRIAAYQQAQYPWYECCRRRKPELWRQALDVIRGEDREARRINALPLARLFEPTAERVPTSERN